MNLITLIKNAYQHFRAGVSARRRQRHLQNQILNDISKFIKKHCAKMSLDPGYRKKLVQSINDSLSHVSALLDLIPGPVDLDPQKWEDQPVLHSIFLTPDQITALVRSSRELKLLFKHSTTTEAIALLTATMKEKTVFGTGKTGEMIRRDVPQKAVYFENQQILAPAADINESQNTIKHLALTSLCSQIFKETGDLAAWKKELEQQQHLIDFKLKTENGKTTEEEHGETVQLLSDIKNKITSINTQINVSDEHLNRITQIFENPENHMTLTPKTLKLNRLGVQMDAGSMERADEFSIAEFQFGQLPRKAAIWVRIRKASIS